MSMHIAISHLPDSEQQRELEHLVLVITHASDVEAIIYLGGYLNRRTSRSCFIQDGLAGSCQSGYNLLIITAPGEKRADGIIQDRIENRCRKYAAVHTILLGSSSLAHSSRTSSFFLAEAFRKGLLLYHAGRIPLPVPGALPLREHVREAFMEWKASGKKALRFFRGAAFYTHQHEYRLAAFMLHQAAERALSAAVFVFTGLRTKTHNLGRLLQYTNLFSTEFSKLFPASGPEEKTLFDTLQRAYTEARYSENYQAEKKELQVLSRRVDDLLELSVKLCAAKLRTLKKTAAAQTPATDTELEEGCVDMPVTDGRPPENLGKFISNALKPIL